MTLRRYILAIAFAVGAFSVASAQSLDAFKERLATPATSGLQWGQTRVTVTEHGDAARAVAQASHAGQRLRLRGYRVCIFFDNGQDARAGAESAKRLFVETYPSTQAYMVYDTPYFKVTVGDCLTAEEAIVLKGRVSATFPKAFVKNEEVSLADLLR